MVLIQLLPRFASRTLLGAGGLSALAARVPRPPVASMATVVTAGLEADSRLRVAQLLGSGDQLIGKTVTVKGWVRTIRYQKTFAFIEVNDGSSLAGVQVRRAPPALALSASRPRLPCVRTDARHRASASTPALALSGHRARRDRNVRGCG